MLSPSGRRFMKASRCGRISLWWSRYSLDKYFPEGALPPYPSGQPKSDIIGRGSPPIAICFLFFNSASIKLLVYLMDANSSHTLAKSDGRTLQLNNARAMSRKFLSIPCCRESTAGNTRRCCSGKAFTINSEMQGHDHWSTLSLCSFVLVRPLSFTFFSHKRHWTRGDKMKYHPPSWVKIRFQDRLYASVIFLGRMPWHCLQQGQAIWTAN